MSPVSKSHVLALGSARSKVLKAMAILEEEGLAPKVQEQLLAIFVTLSESQDKIRAKQKAEKPPAPAADPEESAAESGLLAEALDEAA